ncbi:MAG: hypothetical protein KGJ62_06910 [Armatimonadetes bacterium]|nr:hypothetical protein [Armatimonadota bacterium]MDE2206265.1 hypothetical protein [Armatimonadota bacterium]
MKSIALRQIASTFAASVCLCAPAFASPGLDAGHGTHSTKNPKAFLVVAAPSGQAALWQRIVTYLPTAFRRGPGIRVVETTQAAIASAAVSATAVAADGDGPVDGLYLPPPDAQDTPAEVMVRQGLRGMLAGLVFTHELGHYVWQTELTRTQREAYRALWKSRVELGGLITTYADASPQEGFAEAFAWYVRRPIALRRVDAKSYDFVAQLAHPKSLLRATQRTLAPKGAD